MLLLSVSEVYRNLAQSLLKVCKHNLYLIHSQKLNAVFKRSYTLAEHLNGKGSTSRNKQISIYYYPGTPINLAILNERTLKSNNIQNAIQLLKHNTEVINIIGNNDTIVFNITYNKVKYIFIELVFQYINE